MPPPLLSRLLFDTEPLISSFLTGGAESMAEGDARHWFGGDSFPAIRLVAKCKSRQTLRFASLTPALKASFSPGGWGGVYYLQRNRDKRRRAELAAHPLPASFH